ncbi:hypothetical protein NA57DRAFT_46583 [Rhizodiscina lignyota]|uniref:DUF6536 domain-containing protein n=1 Tax=Rhizodiscina lignyota TaxID=1504668 RepID=A0A9P4I5Y8_9PEZI|nr:hypothetical protein NA57DRAFT_46583 [Rhizodiscina lignyota]
MLRIQTVAAFLVFAANIGIITYAVSSYPPDSRQIGTFTLGNCNKVSIINNALHVGLNIISSLFLGAGNYCMQVLVAPSREEIDRAHSMGVSLEIGVPSIKNLRYIQRQRVLIYAILGLVSTILHLFWNSAIFTSIPVSAIPRAIATDDFMVAGDNWTVSDPLGHFSFWKPNPNYGNAALNKSLIYSLQIAAPNFTRLDTRDCIARYINPLNSTSKLIVVAGNMSSLMNNGSSLIDGWVSAWQSWQTSAWWICSAQTQDQYNCNEEFAATFADHWQLLRRDQLRITVDHCLAGDEANNQERCGLHYSADILAFVCVCTLISSLLIGWTWFKHRHDVKAQKDKKNRRTMITLGDTIHNFLESPSSTHAESAAMTRKPDFVEAKLAVWHPNRIPWSGAITFPAWILSILLFVTGLAVAAYFVASPIVSLRKFGLDMSASGIWKQGFKSNAATTHTGLGPFLHTDGTTNLKILLGNTLIANSPQLAVSFLYLFYNNILTREVVADEWIRFLRKDGKKPLRVSSPIGMQRSSYFLSLPWKYSGPLMGCSILLHWLISQSIFVVQSSSFGPGADGGRLPVYDGTGRGSSILGSILAITLAAGLVIALLVNSVLRHYVDIPPGFQLMGFNSSAIRTVCQRPKDDSDAYLYPISLGIVRDEQYRISGCTHRLVFSTDIDQIQPPEAGAEFIGPCFVDKKNKQWKLTDMAKNNIVTPTIKVFMGIWLSVTRAARRNTTISRKD